MRSILSAILIFPCLLLYSQKNIKKDSIDVELSQCLDKTENQTTAGMCDCTYEALDQWDKKLNFIYKSLLTKLDSTGRNKLTEAQREWIKFKDKEIELIDATYGQADGTMWRISRADKVMQITRQRAVDLETLLETMDDF